jgi:hypothetical protein
VDALWDFSGQTKMSPETYHLTGLTVRDALARFLITTG